MHYTRFTRVSAVEEYHAESPNIPTVGIVDPDTERMKGSQYLCRRLWRWRMVERVIFLDGFFVQTRASTRHQWAYPSLKACWDGTRNGSYQQLMRSHVPTMSSVLQEQVLMAFISQIRFETDDEKRGTQR